MQKFINFHELAVEVTNANPPHGMHTRIIAIDGCGGAGKSTLAKNLSCQLNDCPVIHTDDFASWDNPLNWYPRIIEQVFFPLSVNKSAIFQRFDWSEKRLSNWITVAPQNFVILEGVSSSRKEFRPFLSFAIFVKTSRDVRLRRGLERDGITAKDQWNKWMADEDLYLEQHQPERFANVVVSGETSDINNLMVLNRKMVS